MTAVLDQNIVTYALADAVGRFGGQGDGLFNLAGFGMAMAGAAGLRLDTQQLRRLLAGRPDVEQLAGGAHFRFLRRKPDTARPRSGEQVPA